MVSHLVAPQPIRPAGPPCGQSFSLQMDQDYLPHVEDQNHLQRSRVPSTTQKEQQPNHPIPRSMRKPMKTTLQKPQMSTSLR